MKKYMIKRVTFLSVLVLCIFLTGCGCSRKKKDPAAEQVLKISITPEPSPTPDPEKIDQNAVVRNGSITMINGYLTSRGDESE